MRLAHSQRQAERMHSSEITTSTPGPGSYERLDRPQSTGALTDRPSHWAASRVKRLPDPPTVASTSDPGKYTVSDQRSVANVTSAKASPSVRAQRGAAAFSSMTERDLGGASDAEDTPGPGYYQPHYATTNGDAASTPFRSRLKQRPVQPTGDAPPVGHYRLDSRWTSRAEVNSASPAFKSAVPRFGKVRRPTSPELGPGKYPVSSTHQRFRDAPRGHSFNTSGARGSLVEGTSAITPGPGSYDLFDKSSALPPAPSHWAASRVKRLPDPPTVASTSDPGKYTVSDQRSVANVTSAKASPSVRAQRGAAAFSSMTERDLGGASDAEDTPGPGYYQPHYATTNGDAASTPFRSRLKQRPVQPTGDAPPVGHYRLDSRWTSREEFNSPAFKSAAPRFGKARRPTSPELGPGAYDPAIGEEARERRARQHGPIGAESYPFSSSAARSCIDPRNAASRKQTAAAQSGHGASTAASRARQRAARRA